MNCDQQFCGGCYEIGPGIHIHPPRILQAELDWRAYWEHKARDRERRMPRAAKKLRGKDNQGTLFAL